MKTYKRKTTKKTRKVKKYKGGHKVFYNIAGPRHARHRYLTENPRSNCAAGVMNALGYMTYDTAEYLATRAPNGLYRNIFQELVETQYRGTHTWVHFQNNFENDILQMLNPGEAMPGYFDEHYIVVSNIGGTLFAIDPQSHVQMPLNDYVRYDAHFFVLNSDDVIHAHNEILPTDINAVFDAHPEMR